MNKLNSGKQLENFLNSLSKESGIPDRDFRKKLHLRILSIYKQNKFNFFDIMKKSSYILIGSASTLAVLLILGSSFLIHRNIENKEKNLNNTKSKEEDILEKTNIKDILSKIDENNNLNRAIREQNIFIINNETHKFAENDPFAYYNYAYSKFNRELGPANNTCALFPQTTQTDIYYNYWNDETKEVASKLITLDTEGKIISYQLRVNDSLILYNGGKYAIASKPYNDPYAYYEYLSEENTDENNMENSEDNINSEEFENDVSSYPPDEITSEDSIESYFGQDTKLVGYETINGKNYYIIEWINLNYPCDEESNKKVIYRSWYDDQDYTIYKEEMYLDSVSANNLIFTNTYTFEYKKASWEEISSFFVNDLKNIDIKNVQEDPKYMNKPEQEKAKQIALDKNLVLVIPNGYTTKTLNINTSILAEPNIYEALICNKDFFIDDEIGQITRNNDCNYNPYNEEPYKIGEVYFSDSSTEMRDIAVFDGTLDTYWFVEGIKRIIDLDASNKVFSIEKSDIKIDNTNVEAYVIYSGYYYTCIFEYKGFNYIINLNYKTPFEKEIPSFTSVDIQTNTGKQKIFSLIDNYYNNTSSKSSEYGIILNF